MRNWLNHEIRHVFLNTYCCEQLVAILQSPTSLHSPPPPLSHWPVSYLETKQNSFFLKCTPSVLQYQEDPGHSHPLPSQDIHPVWTMTFIWPHKVSHPWVAYRKSANPCPNTPYKPKEHISSPQRSNELGELSQRHQLFKKRMLEI